MSPFFFSFVMKIQNKNFFYIVEEREYHCNFIREDSAYVQWRGEWSREEIGLEEDFMNEGFNLFIDMLN